MTYADVFIRLMFAVVIGFFIGLEREKHHRPAGIKTHILVCVGATVIALIQIQLVENILEQVLEDPSLAGILRSDSGRMTAQVISGIGFLGAGTIIRTKGSVKGLTTAATLWLVACLGLGAGFGYYVITAGAFLIVMAVLVAMKFLQPLILGSKGTKDIEVLMINKKDAMEEIENVFSSGFVAVKSIDFPEDQDESYHYGNPVIKYRYSVTLSKGTPLEEVIKQLNIQKSIIKAYVPEE